ncbi:MAG: cupin domain-containing protein [Proteobacteria bacterium]|nr:cupin domain-containing protein [Pseudomonadota bacterium]
MAFEEQIPRVYLSREDMLKRVARFKDLKGFDGGLPDSYMPDSMRILYNVIGFQPPPGEQGAVTSPVGAKAARMSSIKISEGFNLGYCEALPGKGPMMHNHDTNETFICMTGRWRASWEDAAGGVESVDLEPLDVISFPPGMIRRFENVTNGPADQYSVLMFVIAGDAPAAEFSKQAMDEIETSGVLAAHPIQTDTDDWLAPRTVARG